MKKTKQSKKSKQPKQSKGSGAKQPKQLHRADPPKATSEESLVPTPPQAPPVEATRMPVLVAVIIVLVLLVISTVWALTRDNESLLTPSVNNVPTTLKVINSQPTDVPKSQAAPSQSAPQQSTGQSLQNAPAPSKKDCLAMGISACN
jgi:hypothetical protein